MKNVLILGLGLAILVVCRYQQLGASIYILGGMIVLLAMSDVGRKMLGEKMTEKENSIKKSAPAATGHGQKTI